MQLFPHQIRGAEFISKRRFSGLFYGVGTGKTITALEAVAKIQPRRVLVIGPPISLTMWQREAESYLSRPAVVLKTGKTPITADIAVVSYNIATKRSAELRDWLDGGVLICDESHALKSTKAKRTKAILGRGGICEGAGHSTMLTGTPITRHNDDVYPFMIRADRAGMRSRCGGDNLDRFQLRYTVRQKKQFPGSRWPVEMVVGSRNSPELAEWMYTDAAIRVDSKEVFEAMPPITINEFEVGLVSNDELKALIKDLNRLTNKEIEQAIASNDEHIASIRKSIGEAKVPAVASEILSLLDSGLNVLCGFWHKSVGELLSANMIAAGKRVAVIDGTTPSKVRDQITEDWNNGELDVLFGQIAACGVSINLQHGGNHILMAEIDWSPAMQDQFYGRLHRYGQKQHVHVTVLNGPTKLDQAVSRIVKSKASNQKQIDEIGKELTS